MEKTYSEKLKDPRWQKKRLEILERDKFACQSCHDTKTTLHVHHKMYLKNKDVWDYPNGLLITLCEDCHLSAKEMKYEMEELLLSTIYQKGFRHEDLLEIASAFSCYKAIIAPHLAPMALGEFFNDEIAFISFLKRHYKSEWVDKKIKEFANGC